MEELEKSLEKLCDSMQEFKFILELLDKYKKPEIVAQQLLQKKIEDGLLANLHNANSYQIKRLKNAMYFRYYDINDIHPILDIAYNRAIRREKMKKIESGI